MYVDDSRIIKKLIGLSFCSTHNKSYMRMKGVIIKPLSSGKSFLQHHSLSPLFEGLERFC